MESKPKKSLKKTAAEPARKYLEADLYPPLKTWLEEAGYIVHGEVGGCDVAARRGDELVLIEIKKTVNLDLLLQVVRRQKARAAVYAAVPAPRRADKRWRELTRLLKRLEVGLILIYLESVRPRAELAFHPVREERRQRSGPTRALLSEMSGRSRDLNVGGSVRKKLMTAYREQALVVAAALERSGPASPKLLRGAGTSEKTGQILRDNHYGWFERISYGHYGLTEPGREALIKYEELVKHIAAALSPPAEAGPPAQARRKKSAAPKESAARKTKR